MSRKITGLIILCAVFFSVISPVSFAVIHTKGKDKVLIALDVCHASSPFQLSNTTMPLYHEWALNYFPVPKFTGFYTAFQPTFKPLLLAASEEKPPRA